MRTWMSRGVLTLGALLTAGGTAANPAFPQGVEFDSKAAKITLGGRIQMQARTSSCSDFPVSAPCAEQEPTFDWFLRRARLEIGIQFDDFVEGKFSPDFAPNSSEFSDIALKDAYGQLNFSRSARLRFGQFKRPFDGFQLTSSTEIRTIERGIDIPGVSSSTAVSFDELTEKFNLSSHNVGIQLSGRTESGLIEYWVGTFNGNSAGDNGADTDGKQLVGRVQVSLQAADLPLKLAVAGAVTNAPFTNASGARDGRYYTDFEIYAQLGDYNGGPHLQAGVFLGDSPLQDEFGGSLDLAAGDDFASAWATQVVGSVKIPLRDSRRFTAIEPVLRVTYADPNRNTGDDAAWGITPGVQVFFASRQKVAFNWDFLVLQGNRRNVNSFKAQYQFYY
ncbi:MAG: porin [Gemmatimonadota bacterium]